MVFIGKNLNRDELTNGSFSQACHEAICQLISVQVFPDEDHLAPPLLAFFPWLALRVFEKHVDRLVNKPVLHAPNRQDALRAKKVYALLLQKPANPLIELLLVNLPSDINTYRTNTIVMLVLMLIREKLIFLLQDPVE